MANRQRQLLPAQQEPLLGPSQDLPLRIPSRRTALSTQSSTVYLRSIDEQADGWFTRCFRCRAWTMLFVNLLAIFINAILLLLSKICCPLREEEKRRNLNDAKMMFDLCWAGLDPWTAIVFGVLGVDIVTKWVSVPVERFNTPSAELDKAFKIKLRKYEELSRLMEGDFYLGTCDYDLWRPEWQINVARRIIRFANWVYRPERSQGKRITAKQAASAVQLFTDIGAQIEPRFTISFPNSAEGMERWCTLGYGAPFLEKDTESDGYIVDMSCLETVDVRPGFSRYGGKVFLDADMKFQRLRLHGKDYAPGDEEWHAVTYIFRTSCVVPGVWIHHVWWCHYLSGGFVATASRKYLPADHPLRRVLSIFTVGTISVNVGATEIISAPGAVLFRGSGLTQEASDNVVKLYGFDSPSEATPLRLAGRWGWKQQSCEEELRGRGVADLPKEAYPYGYFGKKLSNIYQQFAKEYVAEYWRTNTDVASDEHLQRFFEGYAAMFNGKKCDKLRPKARAETPADIELLISHMMWVVSAVHEQSGRTVEIWHDRLGFTFAGGEDDYLKFEDMLPDVSARLALYFVQALVHRPGAALMQEDPATLQRFLLADCNPEIMVNFQHSLRKLSDEIAEFNKTSPDPLVMLDPKELEMAVTV